MSRSLFENAYRRFWDHLESQTPRYPPFSYDLCASVGKVKWHNPFVDFMVDGELRESINLLNAWIRKLSYLEIWSKVLCDYSEDDAWSLRLHFVEPLVYYCMLQPSSTRDRLGQVATNAIHQINLSPMHGCKDVLNQDKLKPGRFLGRVQMEAQLGNIAGRWEYENACLRRCKFLILSSIGNKPSSIVIRPVISLHSDLNWVKSSLSREVLFRTHNWFNVLTASITKKRSQEKKLSYMISGEFGH